MIFFVLTFMDSKQNKQLNSIVIYVFEIININYMTF